MALSPSPKKRKESWLGLAITAVLCLGFLWWWFRPESPETTPNRTTAELAALAAAEPRPQSEPQQWALEFDFMELAIRMASAQMVEEVPAVVRHIRHPIMESLARRKVALQFTRIDGYDVTKVFALIEGITDAERRAAAMGEMLEELARAGFSAAALPHAGTTARKARLACTLAGGASDEDVAAARSLLQEIEPQIGAGDEDARVFMAGAYVALSLFDGPERAIPMILALPPPRQAELWVGLFGNCGGRGDTAEAESKRVLEAIPDPALRERLEIDAIRSPVVVRPAGEIIEAIRERVAGATDAAIRFEALRQLAEAQSNNGEQEHAQETLRTARQLAASTTDAAARCRRLLELAHDFSDLSLLEESAAILTASEQAAEAVPPPARAGLLLEVARAIFFRGEPVRAHKAADAALALSAQYPPDHALQLDLARWVLGRGDWPRALEMIHPLPGPQRSAALQSLAESAAEDSFRFDLTEPLRRGEPLDTIRQSAGSDEATATDLAQKQPAGYSRARAWLALAIGKLSPPAAAVFPTDLKPPESPPLPPEDEPAESAPVPQETEK